MCTVSWVRTVEGGFHLLCNRDEKKTRRPAHAPVIVRQAGIQYIAPVDGDFGGTWIATNERGLALCLLNGANCGLTPTVCLSGPFLKSRGVLPRQYIGTKSLEELENRIGHDDLKGFAPFTLLALSPERDAMVFEWNGFELGATKNAGRLMPLMSSSFEPETVRKARREAFYKLQRKHGRLDSALLYSFHEHHGAGPSPYSTCMHRPDAETVSFSWITVNAESVSFFYTAGAPCQWRPGVNRQLCRKA